MNLGLHTESSSVSIIVTRKPYMDMKSSVCAYTLAHQPKRA